MIMHHGNSHLFVSCLVVLTLTLFQCMGPPVGSRFEVAYANGDYAHCEPGVEELSGAVLCPAPSSANVVYLFSGTWDGPDGVLPPRSLVRNWTLSQISWSPPP
jgi:hypothetical protein